MFALITVGAIFVGSLSAQANFELVFGVMEPFAARTSKDFLFGSTFGGVTSSLG